MKRLLADRNARWYLGGEVFSLFGDTAMFLAMGIWVKELTGSSAQAGLTFFFFTLAVAMAPVAGLVVDRLPRKAVLMGSNLAAAVIVLALLGVHGRGQVWLIWVVAFFYGFVGNFLTSAQSALLATMLPDELLVSANSFLRTAREGLRLVGPLVGAGLFAAVGGGAVAVIDAVTFLIAASSLLMVHVAERKPEPRVGRWRDEIIEGARHIGRVIVLRQVVITAAIACLFIGFLEPVAFAVVGQGLHRKATFLGVLLAVQGIGAVVGGVSSSSIIRRLGEGPVIGLGLLLLAAGSALLIPANLWVVFAGSATLGMSLPWIIVAANTIIQRRTPNELQGRVASAFDTMASLPQTISIAAGAALLAVIDYRLLLLTAVVAITASALYLLTRKEQWVKLPTAAAEPGTASADQPEAAPSIPLVLDEPIGVPATFDAAERRESPGA